MILIQNKIKEIARLSYQINNVENSSDREIIDNDLKNILLELKKQAIESFESESDLKKFLDNIVNFNNYSYNNQFLIWLQNPNTQYVASLKTFNDMGYKVNKDEKGIKILIPSFFKLVKVKLNDGNYEIKSYSSLSNEEKQIYKNKDNNNIIDYENKLGSFRVGTVFDIEQTNMPIEEISKSLNPILEDGRAEGIEDIFIKAIYRDGFRVKYVDKIDSGAKGYCDLDNKLIVARKNMGNLMRLKVIIHEYAHALAHSHLLENKLDYKLHRNKYESEAESIAYVVSKYLGLDTRNYSTMYLYTWSKDKDFKEIDDSLSTIVNYSKKIIKNFEAMYEKEFDLCSNFQQIAI